MPTAYRIEVCPNNRATCSQTECKKEGVKLTKGELRFGNMVEIKEHQSWQYKHWGCVTPYQLDKWWNDLAEQNLDLVDGYEELPDAQKVKVKRALEQGHVDDDDWKGDVEKNRPGEKGFRTPKKKQAAPADASNGDEGVESPSKSKAASKKRGRPAKTQDDDVNEEVPKKKAKGHSKKPKTGDTDATNEAPPKKRGRPKKAADSETAAKPAKKRGRPKKEETEDAGDTEASGKKRGRPKKVKEANADGEKPAKKRGRPKKERDDEEDAPPKKRGRPRKGSPDAMNDQSELAYDTTTTVNPAVLSLEPTGDLSDQ